MNGFWNGFKKQANWKKKVGAGLLAGGLLAGGAKVLKHHIVKDKALQKKVIGEAFNPKNPSHIKKMLDYKGIKYK